MPLKPHAVNAEIILTLDCGIQKEGESAFGFYRFHLIYT